MDAASARGHAARRQWLLHAPRRPVMHAVAGHDPDRSGKCICPNGTELQNGACRKVEQPPARQCKLLPGMIRTQSGKCICPKGTELKNGACRKVEQPPVRQCKLLPGQIRTENGRCICPRGTKLAQRPMPQDDSRVSARHAAEERHLRPGGHRRSEGLPGRHGRQISELPQARTGEAGV